MKKRRAGPITMELSQKFIDNLLGLFMVTAKSQSPQMVSIKINSFGPKRGSSQVTKRVIHFSGPQ